MKISELSQWPISYFSVASPKKYLWKSCVRNSIDIEWHSQDSSVGLWSREG